MFFCAKFAPGCTILFWESGCPGPLRSAKERNFWHPKIQVLIRQICLTTCNFLLALQAQRQLLCSLLAFTDLLCLICSRSTTDFSAYSSHYKEIVHRTSQDILSATFKTGCQRACTYVVPHVQQIKIFFFSFFVTFCCVQLCSYLFQGAGSFVSFDPEQLFYPCMSLNFAQTRVQFLYKLKSSLPNPKTNILIDKQLRVEHWPADVTPPSDPKLGPFFVAAFSTITCQLNQFHELDTTIE